MKQKLIIPSVNFHLWQPCNMRCGFCFSKFEDVKNSILPKGHLPKEEAIKTIEFLAHYGFSKITFVGGEPTLCPWISELIKFAKIKGLTTMIVSNGTKLTDHFLKENKPYLDWIAISIDSINKETNKKIGRTIKQVGVDNIYYDNLFKKIKKFDYKLKINTVVNKHNFKEDLTDFINQINPSRWKVFKVLPIEQQNKLNFDEFKISNEEFYSFLKNHNSVANLVKETNNDMTGSYIMVDPAGRFFDNVKGKYRYSSKIIEQGVLASLQEIEICYSKFINRDGLYNW
ncbi:viperin family antiviral radical SAM protein [Tenacibaculum finnmarkense]|uniref:viperin family antiviral radical SAM protein n=1 Tax=Tenacibaculum finnmarkense TaxID=2781243 RepID=UPI001E65A879|nr:viperin family antiviral radical SAM protein [Tenacibaculum finnmarkense]MCD8423218.1 viperin family antiviral radical SAM protein [Tenacibaculum finnmarkense genomovar ulcerans]MCG8239511.1 viperin family antiviral radical SAM protein [Tenacibaculum finnmarkense genomovar ulcerans]MCG8803655.1 radical SAM protein [Tenacibaculum finnmarkense]MCG8826470.1 radical SAM protein [Tenacibaculum finnmarkense]